MDNIIVIIIVATSIIIALNYIIKSIKNFGKHHCSCGEKEAKCCKKPKNVK